MPRRPSTFRESDLTRAVNAARKAGLTVASVEVAPDGTIRIRAGAETSEPANMLPFDEWRAKRDASPT